MAENRQWRSFDWMLLATVALGGKAHMYEEQPAWKAALDAWSMGRRG